MATATAVCARSTTPGSNLRAGITKACFYEPAFNRTYAEVAIHYSIAIVPAWPYRTRLCLDLPILPVFGE
jgi:hypothetical protein